VIVDAPLPIPMPAPADTDKAPLEPFSKETLFRALLEALMVRDSDPAPEALAKETLFPPNKARLTAVPVTDVPPPLRLWVAAAVGDAPMIVIEDAPELNVMFAPATSETLLDVPFRVKLVATNVSLIVIDDAFWLRLMLLPATSETLPVELLKLNVPPPPPPPVLGTYSFGT
jgi:hypothetical protein